MIALLLNHDGTISPVGAGFTLDWMIEMLRDHLRDKPFQHERGRVWLEESNNPATIGFRPAVEHQG